MSDEVVRLDGTGRITGIVDKETAHTEPLVPHLAFSVFVFDPEGRLLLQRRSAGKRTFPGLWSNSCCSHPRPGETLQAAARRRVREELGVTIETFELKGGFWYRAFDESGRGEHEYDLVLTGPAPRSDLDPDPQEVGSVMWVPLTVAQQYPDGAPDPGITPWFKPALEIALGPARHIDVMLP